MDKVMELIFAANALTLNVRKGLSDTSAPSTLYKCVNEAKVLRMRASSVAISLPKGRDRDFANTVRMQAIDCEKSLRKRLRLPAASLG